jgi:hypothetical protein
MTYYYGFDVGDRVTSGENSRGTVTRPGYEPSDEMNDSRCVPVVWDKDKGTETISWTKSANLRKLI